MAAGGDVGIYCGEKIRARMTLKATLMLSMAFEICETRIG